jgi:hypothetical protein
MKDIFKLLILFLILSSYIWGPFLFVPVYFSYISYIYPKVEKEIPMKILNYPEVTKAEILRDEDILEFTIDIHLEDNKRLLLGNVNEKLKGNIRIERVDDLKMAGNVLYPKLLSHLLGIKIKSVKDIIINYNKIYELVETWPNFSKLKETGNDSRSEIKKRHPDLFIPIEFNGEKYILATMSWEEDF